MSGEPVTSMESKRFGCTKRSVEKTFENIKANGKMSLIHGALKVFCQHERRKKMVQNQAQQWTWVT